MNKKLSTIALIIVAAGIWIAAVILLRNKFYNNPADNDNYVAPVTSIINDENGGEVQKIELLLNYKDPFLKNTYVPTVNLNPNGGVDAVKPLTQQWPEIVFVGVVKNNTSLKKVALITINQEEMLLGINDEYEGIKLVSIAQDELILTFAGEKKKITLQ